MAHHISLHHRLKWQDSLLERLKHDIPPYLCYDFLYHEDAEDNNKHIFDMLEMKITYPRFLKKNKKYFTVSAMYLYIPETNDTTNIYIVFVCEQYTFNSRIYGLRKNQNQTLSEWVFHVITHITLKAQSE